MNINIDLGDYYTAIKIVMPLWGILLDLFVNCFPYYSYDSRVRIDLILLGLFVHLIILLLLL